MSAETSTQQAKLELATQIGKLEGDISASENELRQQESKFNSAKGNRTAGAAALLIGILGGLFLFALWPLWGFLCLIGAATLITAMMRQGAAELRIEEIKKDITDKRAKLAELRARMMI